VAGSLHTVINNAGIIQVGPLDHMTLSDYDDAMKIHFWGALYMVLAVLPQMRNQGGGRTSTSRRLPAGCRYPTCCRIRRARVR
jgi:NAD(P)-dependent dehydrogenase (short-subunit alcohol dehydrogenase family)